MLALFFCGDRKIELKTIEEPLAHDDMVVVKIKAAAICGTDRENFVGEGQTTVPGHEVSGIVVKTDYTKRVKEGDRVALNVHLRCGECDYCSRGMPYLCTDVKRIGSDRNGGFAEYIAVPESCCMPLPDDLTLEQGALIVDMLGTPYSSFRKIESRIGEYLVIWGAGPIGLGALMIAVHRGLKVAVIDHNQYRLEMAHGLGSELIVDPKSDDAAVVLKEWTRGKGITSIMECTGNDAALRQGLDLIAPRGIIAVVGVSRSLHIDPWMDLISRETTLTGSLSFEDSHFDEMISLIRGGLPLSNAITHRFPLKEARQAFEVFESSRCGKVIFTG